MVKLSRWLAGYRSKVRTGLEFSGWVESEGAEFKKGQRVMGYIDMTRGHNSHAQWLTISESQLAAIPDSLGFAEAASLPMSAQTALVALKSIAKVVVSGFIFRRSEVGLCLVQLARHYGRMTAVAKAAHHARLKELGADEVVDYREVPVSEMKGAYRAIFEFSDRLSLSDVLPLKKTVSASRSRRI